MKKAVLFGLLLALLCGCTNAATDNTKPKEQPQADSLMTTDSTLVRYLEALPVDYNEDDAFSLILDYGNVDMIVGTWKMPDNDWLITSHWCDLEDGGEEGDAEVVYKDPFEGKPYPVLHNPDFSFATRNYGGEAIYLYKAANSQEVACTINYQEIVLHVLDVDPATRRLLVQSDPKDWCWGEVEEEWQEGYRHPFVELRGWIDEEWVCANTVTTCP
jgi:hypothetical protein